MRPSTITFALLLTVPSVLLSSALAIEFGNSVPLTYDDGNGNTLLYRLSLPPGYDTPGKEFPLVVFMHGSGQIGSDNVSQMLGIDGLVLDSQTERHASFVLAPQVQPGQGGWGTFTRGLTYDLMKTIEQQYAVDTSRRFVTGLSMGGFGTWRFMSDHPGEFEAAIPMSAWGNPADAAPYLSTRIWSFNGNNDTATPPDLHRQTVQAVLEAGGDAIYTEVVGGHDIWGPLYDDPTGELYDWMFDGVEPPLGSLVYNPISGGVKIDARQAPGGAITLFQLKGAPGDFAIPETVVIDGEVVSAQGLFRGLTDQLVYYDVRGTEGFSNVFDLGNIFPTGLDFSGLHEFVASHRYLSPAAGSQARTLNLIVEVPEPTTAAMGLLLGGCLLSLRPGNLSTQP